jgi:hypothetical protein
VLDQNNPTAFERYALLANGDENCEAVDAKQPRPSQ